MQSYIDMADGGCTRGTADKLQSVLCVYILDNTTRK